MIASFVNGRLTTDDAGKDTKRTRLIERDESGRLEKTGAEKMKKIDTKFLREYLALDREVKEKSKLLNEKKAAIIKELKARKGKAITTRFFIAAFVSATRTLYNIPTEIKNKYKEIKEYDQLKVTEKKR
jgi:hypothetical protein